MANIRSTFFPSHNLIADSVKASPGESETLLNSFYCWTAGLYRCLFVTMFAKLTILPFSEGKKQKAVVPLNLNGLPRVSHNEYATTLWVANEQEAWKSATTEITAETFLSQRRLFIQLLIRSILISLQDSWAETN